MLQHLCFACVEKDQSQRRRRRRKKASKHCRGGSSSMAFLSSNCAVGTWQRTTSYLLSLTRKKLSLSRTALSLAHTHTQLSFINPYRNCPFYSHTHAHSYSYLGQSLSLSLSFSCAYFGSSSRMREKVAIRVFQSVAAEPDSGHYSRSFKRISSDAFQTSRCPPCLR